SAQCARSVPGPDTDGSFSLRLRPRSAVGVGVSAVREGLSHSSAAHVRNGHGGDAMFGAVDAFRNRAPLKGLVASFGGRSCDRDNWCSCPANLGTCRPSSSLVSHAPDDQRHPDSELLVQGARAIAANLFNRSLSQATPAGCSTRRQSAWRSI